jgi:Family of unknown function (DUF5329)
MPHWLRHILINTATGAITALLAAHAAAQPARSAADEIQYLLGAMERSGCEFQRNGSWHSVAEARAHLERKLADVEKKQPMRSAGEFIDAVATRSSVTGEPYRVRCPGAEPVPSAAWFRQTLERYRQTAPPTR